MTDNLPVKLRAIADALEKYLELSAVARDCRAAADEIERLRATNNAMSLEIANARGICRAIPEQSLCEAVRSVSSHYANWRAGVQSEIERLRAELAAVKAERDQIAYLNHQLPEDQSAESERRRKELDDATATSTRLADLYARELAAARTLGHPGGNSVGDIAVVVGAQIEKLKAELDAMKTDRDRLAAIVQSYQDVAAGNVCTIDEILSDLDAREAAEKAKEKPRTTDE
jgi:uncharacterized small protein (DUF1192 family)